MATVKKGHLTMAGEWWKHLRWTKRLFWKGERQAGKQEAQQQIESVKPTGKASIRFTASPKVKMVPRLLAD
jgi:hypothetical protein